jgi:hypothetical protein
MRQHGLPFITGKVTGPREQPDSTYSTGSDPEWVLRSLLYSAA